MKNRLLTYSLSWLLCFSLYASGHDIHTLRELEVWGKRPLKDIGSNRTEFDSLALRESSALSMADILTYNSAVFVKNYGRATLSTVSFRGTSPSHTQVTWNGMRINNPMLGMTDFSTIPSFFVDKASLLHGSTSVNTTGGALGGVVQLGTSPGFLTAADSAHHKLQYVQGIGSFRTFDEFARYDYSSTKFSSSTRIAYSSSPNDYTYINHDKKENIYDDEGHIIEQFHPKEKNRSGAWRDLHVMQQLYLKTAKAGIFGVDVWYLNSNRELPLLTTDYGDERGFDNRQREQTLRAVVSWNHFHGKWTFNGGGGYTFTRMAYDYKRETAPNNWSVMTRSRSRINTLYIRGEAAWYPFSRLMLSANVAAYQHFVKSHDKDIITTEGGTAIVGYDRARVELSGALAVRWQPLEPVGLSLVARQEMFGNKTAFIPAFFADAMVYRRLNLILKGSVSRNHRFPSLNDLYFMPGGNPDLRDESGMTYDLGLSMGGNLKSLLWKASAGWFDSYIDDWIIWLPTTKGFFSPRNVKKVHAYGIESRLEGDFPFLRDWLLSVSATYSWTPSVNRGEPMSEADRSVGRQLPYVPLNSASLTASLTWRTWRLLYKWAAYSRRFTMSSNDISLSGTLPPYFMSNLVLEKTFRFRPLGLNLKLAVNNLFNEDYLSVLARPMPGINFEFFIGITPNFR